jgi:hypothetical protein
VLHLLLIGPDLEKSRVVYLASVWFALLLGALWTAAPRPVAVAAAASILAFNLVAMRHNLRIWHSVGNIHIAACDAVSAGAAASPEGIVALSMPNVIDGVYALKTGLPECVEIRHGIPAARVHLERLGSTLPVYEWDAADRKVRRR